jgi:cytochrome c-type biogenesis protein CcmE
MKLKYIIGAIVTLACVGVGMYAIMQSSVSYVKYEEARTASGREVQVIGAIDKKSVQFDRKSGAHVFTIRDKTGDTLKVRTMENLPPNFQHATQLVAIGTYDKGEFNAGRILVKCPSKYEKKAATQQGSGGK